MSGGVGWWVRVGVGTLKWEDVWIRFSFSRGVDAAILERKGSRTFGIPLGAAFRQLACAPRGMTGKLVVWLS